jgi:TPR repeat protein
MRKVLIAGAAAFLAAAAGHAQSVEAGIKAWRSADYKAAVDIWRPLAEAGDADAQFNLGQAYRLGRGVAVNLGAAQIWLGRAAAKDHVDAQTTLGLLLFDSGDRPTGLRWLRAAAEKGEPRAMLMYGTALYNGDGVKQNPVLAYAYISRAAAQGLLPAKTTLAEMDKIMPLAQRKQGVKLAMSKASGGARAAADKGTPKPTATKPSALPTKSAATSPSAPATGPATGSWRVQLGAFSQRGSAETLFRKLSASPALAGRRAFYIPVGAMTRLQVGPFESRAAASRACAALRGQACFPVAGK